MYELGSNGGESETDGTLLTSQTESGYSCEKQQTYRVLFDKPALLQADHWYVACASITSPSGSSSDAGSSGQAVLTGDKYVCINQNTCIQHVVLDSSQLEMCSSIT